MDINVYQGDCLELMKDIPDQSIDMICCDPPYSCSRNSWDKMINLESLWKEYRRIIKEHGCITLFGQGVFSAKLIMSNPKMYRYTWIWEKTKAGGFLNARRMPLQAHEDILVFYKKLPTYNPQMEEGKPYVKKAVSNGDGNNYGKFDRVGEVHVNNGERFPRSVIRFPNDNHNSLHPTQKPVGLLKYLIETYTNEGDTVLDNCMGSGSTGVAAVEKNRSFIGIELDEGYFEIAKKRIFGSMENIT